MLDRQRLRTIVSIGLPIVGGIVSQNVLNLVDTAMVGVLGDVSLAAVGLGDRGPGDRRDCQVSLEGRFWEVVLALVFVVYFSVERPPEIQIYPFLLLQGPIRFCFYRFPEVDCLEGGPPKMFQSRNSGSSQT